MRVHPPRGTPLALLDPEKRQELHSGRAVQSQVKPEDREVVKNLELLEHLDETSDLDLLQELSAER